MAKKSKTEAIAAYRAARLSGSAQERGAANIMMASAEVTADEIKQINAEIDAEAGKQSASPPPARIPEPDAPPIPEPGVPRLADGTLPLPSPYEKGTANVPVPAKPAAAQKPAPAPKAGDVAVNPEIEALKANKDDSLAELRKAVTDALQQNPNDPRWKAVMDRLDKVEAGQAAPKQPEPDTDTPKPFYSKRDAAHDKVMGEVLRRGLTGKAAQERLSRIQGAPANVPADEDEVPEHLKGRVDITPKKGAMRKDPKTGMTREEDWRALVKPNVHIDDKATVLYGDDKIYDKPIIGGAGQKVARDVDRITNNNVYEVNQNTGRFVQQALPGDVALARHFGEGWLPQSGEDGAATALRRQQMLRTEVGPPKNEGWSRPMPAAGTAASPWTPPPATDTAVYGETPGDTSYRNQFTGNKVQVPSGARAVNSKYGTGFATPPPIPEPDNRLTNKTPLKIVPRS